ncbi:hypothetical protein GCM10025859_30850 [Alicyclobacillus fastidiosus]|nr:hypothetical protein GCM10025859_30850 [Alicyclobacillus fastidiosus]
MGASRSGREGTNTLTNRQGHPVTNNQSMRTVGRRGPTTLENYDFLEKITHFDFYTEDGNWDLVGNNLKVFFIRDAMKFPDMVHAFKPDPVTNIQDQERFFDFAQQESGELLRRGGTGFVTGPIGSTESAEGVSQAQASAKPAKPY